MQFAPFPKDLVGLHTLRFSGWSLVSNSVGKDVSPLAGMTSDCWDQVDDFNWLKPGHSPNWSLLRSDDRLDADQWNRLYNVRSENVAELLQISASVRPVA